MDNQVGDELQKLTNNFTVKWSGNNNAIINGHPLYSKTYKFNAKIFRDDLEQDLKNNMKLKNGYYYVMCAYYPFGVRSGELFDSKNYKDKDILYNLWKEYDFNGSGQTKTTSNDKTKQSDKLFTKEEKFQTQYLTLYKFKKNTNKGGGTFVDYHNDCLFRALSKACNGDMPKDIKTKIGLKRYLNLERDDKIGIENIEKIEKLFYEKHNTSINVSGEYVYDTKLNCPKNINLELKNEHYKLKNNKNKNNALTGNFFVKPKSKNEVYIYHEFLNNIYLYNGTLTTCNRKQLYKLYDENIMCKSKDIRIRTLNTSEQKQEYIESILKSEYEETIKLYDEMYEMSKNQINLYKYRSLKDCAIDILRMNSEMVKSPEFVNERESQWISESFMGGFQFYKDCENVDATTIDINSAYSSVMIRKLSIPICEPTFIHYKHETKYFKFGVYRCKVLNKDNIDVSHKITASEKRNKFNHIYLNICINAGLTIEMIEDDECNAMIYDEDKLIKCQDLFGKYIDYFYELKKKKCKLAKSFLNVLYGAMAQKNIHYKIASEKKQLNLDITKHEFNLIFCIFKDIDNPDLMPKTQFEYTNKRFYYKTAYARISPFISSHLYKLLVDKLDKIDKNDILKIHTDSITIKNFDKYKSQFKLSDEIGDWKIENQNNISIKNKTITIN
jgi:hypothetical protein